MTSSRTSWKILIVLIIVGAVFIGVSSGHGGKYNQTPEDMSTVKYPPKLSTNEASSTATSTVKTPVYQQIMVACAAPAKNQVMATGSSTKRLMWSVTPSIEGKIVEGAVIEWSLKTPEKKIISKGQDIGLTYMVNRSDFKTGVKKQTYTIETRITIPTGQSLVAGCAPVDVTLQ